MARTLGNNSLWNVEEAVAHLMKVDALLSEAGDVAKKATERGVRLQDLVLVSAISDCRVKVAQARLELGEARARLMDAKLGVWRGDGG